MSILLSAMQTCAVNVTTTSTCYMNQVCSAVISFQCMQMLHHQHQKPANLFVDYDSGRRPCIFMKPSSKANHASSVNTLSTCINETTLAAATAHRNATGAALPGVAAPGTIPQYTPGASSSYGAPVDTVAETAWVVGSAVATSVSNLAGSVLNSSSRPAAQAGPSAPAMTAYQGYVTPQYYVRPGYPVPAAPAVQAVPPQQLPQQPPAAAAPQTASATTAAPQVCAARVQVYSRALFIAVWLLSVLDALCYLGSSPSFAFQLCN
jgi:hypothetical protein